MVGGDQRLDVDGLEAGGIDEGIKPLHRTQPGNRMAPNVEGSAGRSGNRHAADVASLTVRERLGSDDQLRRWSAIRMYQLGRFGTVDPLRSE
jgi:hypothetical protein